MASQLLFSATVDNLCSDINFTGADDILSQLEWKVLSNDCVLTVEKATQERPGGSDLFIFCFMGTISYEKCYLAANASWHKSSLFNSSFSKAKYTGLLVCPVNKNFGKEWALQLQDLCNLCSDPHLSEGELSMGDNVCIKKALVTDLCIPFHHLLFVVCILFSICAQILIIFHRDHHLALRMCLPQLLMTYMLGMTVQKMTLYISHRRVAWSKRQLPWVLWLSTSTLR